MDEVKKSKETLDITVENIEDAHLLVNVLRDMFSKNHIEQKHLDVIDICLAAVHNALKTEENDGK